MPLILLAHFLARVLGFRHRGSEEFYRLFDVIGGFWLVAPIFAVQALLSGLARWLLPLPMAGVVESIVNVLMTALGICAVTLWMPFVEHMSLSRSQVWLGEQKCRFARYHGSPVRKEEHDARTYTCSVDPLDRPADFA
jgi:hypothetical protein